MSTITNKFLAHMATDTIKGNATGGSSAPSDLSVSQVQTMIGLEPSAEGQMLNSVTSSTFDWTATPTLGLNASVTGKLTFANGGATGVGVTIQNNATTGLNAWNFNLPSTGGSAGQPLLSGGAGTNPMTWGTLSVQYGGTGITSGTSGGIPYYSSTSTIASSTQLDDNQVVIGGGGGGAPSTLAAGTNYQVLYMNGSNPGWGAVHLDQSVAVNGILPITNGGSGLNTTSQNFVFAGPTSGAGAPTWRLLASGDIPNNAANTSGTATNATNIAVTSTSTNANYYPLFVSSSTTGNKGALVSSSILMDPSGAGYFYAGTVETLGVEVDGSTSGDVNIQALGAISSYNFNLPLTAGSAGQALTSQGGGSSAMTWSTILSNPMTTLGDIIYENATPAPARLAGNTTATKQFLSQTGTGSVSAAPVWAR